MSKLENKKYLKNYRHKHYTGIYGSWYAMKQRCDNPNHKQYQDYGGRGISYLSTWKTFEGFKLDMAKGYKIGLTIDRIDNAKSYSVENCRWATRKEQNNNKRNNIHYSYKGITLNLTQWAQKLDLKCHTLLARHRAGWSIERMLTSRLERPWKLN